MTGVQNGFAVATQLLTTLPQACQYAMTWAIQAGFAIVGVFTAASILRFLLFRSAAD